ncbi:MAG TPA: hypothetical protein VJM08_03605 [Anaerolineales bacterium]|nr:hypothetical protein [Anaerolineales bacterium]
MNGSTTAQHGVHPTGGSLRVFEHFVWLEVGSVKMALPRPAHQRVTPAVGLLWTLPTKKRLKSITDSK